MARPPGRRNAGFEERRSALALAASRALLGPGGRPSTLGELAAAAGVSVPTLKHYFGGYEGVVAAALVAAELEGLPYLQATADPGSLPLADSIGAVLGAVVEGWPLGLGRLLAGALTHGLCHEQRGPVVVQHLLEPMLGALEARLAVHAARGELRADAELRVAALALLSPLLLALLHQHELSGAGCRPLDVDAFCASHARGWLAGWGRAP